MKKQFQRARARTVASVIAMAFAAQAWAVEPFNVRDIRVEGLQRVEPGTVFASIPVRVGERYDDDKGTAAIRALFALGLFKDVRLEVQGDVLVVIVEERPTIAAVDFIGTREFDKDTLRKALRDIGLADGRPFDQALADRAEQELKRQYINRSLYGAEVVTTVTPVERNRVNVSFTVNEGETAKIKDIRIVGAKAFRESTLKDLFDLDTGGYLSWYTKSDRYSRVKLNADLETLRSYYLQRGFMEFRIDGTQVAISPNKQEITITVNVTEGDRFVVSGVRLEGNFLGRDEEFKSLITIPVGEPYNADRVTETTKAFTEFFGNFGYAFAQVEARPEVDRATNRVTLVLAADPSRRAYVRRVNIGGNTRTRDEVIRREFRQLESSWYDGDRIKRSRDRVDRLGFFKEVNVETAEVPGAPDQVDLVVNVIEKPTGSVQLSAGFSSAERLALGFGVRQENAFGSGKYLSAELNTSKYNRVLAVSTFDPYFTPDGISRTLDAYHRNSRPYNNQGGNYSLATTGASARFGVPFSELDTVFFGAGVEQTQIRPGTAIPAAYLAYAEEFGYTSRTLPLTLGWSRDNRDSALAPTTGRLQRVSGEAGVAGDARYLRGNYQLQQYFPINKQYTLAFNGELGWGQGLSGRPFPVFKHFYSGGLGSVRGFQQGTLGPRDVTGASIGGPKRLTLNTEVITPFPGAGNDRTLRLYGFVDVGNAFGEEQKFTLNDLRASVGLGVSWISPVGPLRFAVANAVRKFPGDKIQKVQFQIGTAF
ncbi:outer membrane protein assembly factor BamA [Ramlibacter sp. MAHUQ-53]|uniref:outer membrane protein assembly factor BamA n=1 Tax=unclassified Ramlibacter TaxID=2617605 RepID=UPI0036320051